MGHGRLRDGPSEMYRHVRETDGTLVHSRGGIPLPQGDGQDVRGEADGKPFGKISSISKAEAG